MRLFRQFLADPWQPRFVIPLIIINLLGSIYGYFWYSVQLAENPKFLWSFVADSPFAATLFMLVLLLGLVFNYRGKLLQVIAYTAVIKYGIWAVVLIFHFWISGGPVAFTESMLVVSHLGMALEGYIYLRKLRFYFWVIPTVLIWMGLNDFIDYVWGFHPYLYLSSQLPFARFLALSLTLLIALALYIHYKHKPPSIFND